ncbi:hypothetical protein BJ546DRAFT_1064742 [Cryomyces antarcticus]
MAYPDPDDLELPDYPYYASEAGVVDTLYDLADAPGETTMGPRYPILEYDPAFDPGETMMGPRYSALAFDPTAEEGETMMSPRYSTDLEDDPAVDPGRTAINPNYSAALVYSPALRRYYTDSFDLSDASYSAAEPDEEDNIATQPVDDYITVHNRELRCIVCPIDKAPFTRVCTLRRHLKETHNLKVLNPTGNKHPKTAAEFGALEEAQLVACERLLEQRRWDSSNKMQCKEPMKSGDEISTVGVLEHQLMASAVLLKGLGVSAEQFKRASRQATANVMKKYDDL